jgi:DNA processing protein
MVRWRSAQAVLILCLDVRMHCMPSPDARYWVGFQHARRIGPIRLSRLIERFGSIADAWNAPQRELRTVLDVASAESVAEARRTIDLDREMDRIEGLGIEVITLGDDQYPRLLRETPSPPSVLYIKGELQDADQKSVAMVGTRRCTAYGRQIAASMAEELARAGVTIVSGLALGIDGQAHRGALAGGGRTIAVLGSGVDLIYPSSHRDLAAQIIANGAIVSDYPPGTKPDARNFPPRNRIIAGLSRGIVVVEAPARSGALITVDFAADYGRDVFCVPGNAQSEYSAGCHAAIRDGARLVTSAADVLEDLGMAAAPAGAAVQQAFPMTDHERHLMNHIRWEPQHIDEISAAAGLTPSQSGALLTLLELKGAVRDAGGQHYVRV